MDMRWFRKRWRRVLLPALCLVLFAAAGCVDGRAAGGSARLHRDEGAASPAGGGTAEADAKQAPDKPAPLSPEELARVHNRFGLRVFAALLEDHESGANVVLSPTSLALALSMAYNGAAGATAQAMAEALRLTPYEREQVDQASLALLERLATVATARAEGPAVALDIANSIWHSDLFVIHDGFLLDNVRFYRAHVAALDFTVPEAPEAINAWVKEATRGLIPSIVERLDPDVVMLLVNAVSFHGDWTTPFDPGATRPLPFRRADGSEVEVPMMYRDGTAGYFADGRLQAVRLPYGADGRVALYVLLPHDGNDLAAFARDLSADDFERIAGGVRQRYGEVLLPRLDVAYKAELKGVLSALGMETAFRPGFADFSRMAANGSARNLYLGDVLHQAVLKVDEEGTEAAAVTSIDVRLTSVPVYEFRFAADRPFVVAIRDDETGALLFLGAIADPR